MRLQHVASIEREHNFFSAYALASFSGPVASSLLFGDYLIHSYILGILNHVPFLILRTYSRHDNRRFRGSLLLLSSLFFQETLDYLRVSCVSWFIYSYSLCDKTRRLGGISLQNFSKSME
jgi:hypothetical protein